MLLLSRAREPIRALPRIVVLNWRDTTHPEGGGSELYVERVAAGLAQLGHDVTLFCSKHGDAPADERLPNGVRILRRGGRHGVYLQAARAYLRGDFGRPDVVVEVHNGVPFLARLWARRSKVVVLVHHVHREQWKVLFGPVRARVGWWVESRLAPWVNRRQQYVTVSDATRTELVGLGLDPERIQVVHNGTDAPAEHAAPKSATPTLLSLSRLVPHKRIEIALDAVAALRAEFPELVLTVAGRGWWSEPLRQHAADRGLTDAVRFVGWVSEDERNRLLAESWILLVPSVKEGWGLVVVEAGARGTPSIAFAQSGGLTESVVDGVTGVLVPHDDVDGFIAAVGTLVRDPDALHRMGTEAITHARRYTWDAAVKDFAELLETVSRP